MDDEQAQLAEWQAAQQAYDAVLAKLFAPAAHGGQPRSEQLTATAARLREHEEETRLRYLHSRGENADCFRRQRGLTFRLSRPLSLTELRVLEGKLGDRLGGGSSARLLAVNQVSVIITDTNIDELRTNLAAVNALLSAAADTASHVEGQNAEMRQEVKLSIEQIDRALDTTETIAPVTVRQPRFCRRAVAQGRSNSQSPSRGGRSDLAQVALQAYQFG